MNGGPAPIIVTALFGKTDFTFLDGLRKRFYPPERNGTDAHLTLFHHLPPSVAEELKFRLQSETRGTKAPQARLSRLMSLGQAAGVAVMAAIEPDIAQVAARGARSTLDDLGSSALNAEIAAMNHETLNSRIFRT